MGEEGDVIKLMVKGGGQSLRGMDGEMDAAGRREEAWDGLEAGGLVCVVKVEELNLRHVWFGWMKM